LNTNSTTPKIAIVGPCGSGKSTLAQKLSKLDLDIHEIAQEHSYAPEMWKKISNPDVLIYLDVSYHSATDRKKFDWTEGEYLEQVRRLLHARNHCDIYIHTDNLTPDEILNRILKMLDVGHLPPSDV
jgi:cytidylate kinase